MVCGGNNRWILLHGNSTGNSGCQTRHDPYWARSWSSICSPTPILYCFRKPSSILTSVLHRQDSDSMHATCGPQQEPSKHRWLNVNQLTLVITKPPSVLILRHSVCLHSIAFLVFQMFNFQLHNQTFIRISFISMRVTFQIIANKEPG